MALDILIFQFFHQIAERFSFFNFVFVSCAVYLPWAIGFCALLLLFGEKDRRLRTQNILFALLLVVVSRGIITEIVGFLVNRERPYELLQFKPLFDVASSSFPSGHAALLFAIAFSIWHVRRDWASWFFVAASVNVLARVISGVHWFSDIAVGFVISWIVYMAFSRLIKPVESGSFKEVNESL